MKVSFIYLFFFSEDVALEAYAVLTRTPTVVQQNKQW